MFLDAHTHVDTTTVGLRDTPSHVVAALNDHDIVGAACTTYRELPHGQALADAAAVVAPYRHRLHPLARLHPRDPEAPTLLRLAIQVHGMAGLKLHPLATGVPPDAPSSVRLVATAGELGVPTLVHGGPEPVSHPARVAACVDACPHSVVILGHMGGPSAAADAIDVAHGRPNLVLETSTISDPTTIAAAVAAAPGRVVFGSDGPRGHIAVAVAVLARAGLSPASQTDVAGGTMARLLGLPAPLPVPPPRPDRGPGWPLPGEWDVTVHELADVATVVRGVPSTGLLRRPQPIVVAGSRGDVSGREVARLSHLLRAHDHLYVASTGWYRADALRDWAMSGRLMFSSGGGDPVVERVRVAALALPDRVLREVAGGLARRLFDRRPAS